MNNENTTARPWEFYDGGICHQHENGTYSQVMRPDDGGYDGEPFIDISEEDAEYFLKAVNAYDSLKAKAEWNYDFNVIPDDGTLVEILVHYSLGADCFVGYIHDETGEIHCLSGNPYDGCGVADITCWRLFELPKLAKELTE